MEEADGQQQFDFFLENLKSSEVQSRLISLFCKFVDVSFAAGALVCPALGPVHSIVKIFYPNYNQEEIMKSFVDLKRMINKFSNRIMETSIEDRWNHIKTRFLEDIENLESAVRTTSLVLKAGKKEFSNNWMEELMNQGNKLMHSLNHLLDGLSDEEYQCEFDDKILIVFYNYTAGDKRKVEKLCVYLDQLLLNGLASLCVYLTAKKGIDWCHEVVNSLNYQQRLSRSVRSMKIVLERCEKECSANMCKDAKEILRRETGEAHALLLKISEMFFKKYYWMETFLIFYNLIDRNSRVNSKYVSADKTTATVTASSDECDGKQSGDEYLINGGVVIEHIASNNRVKKDDEVDFSIQDDKRFALLIFSRRKPTEEKFPSKSEVVKMTEESINLTTNPKTAFRNIKSKLDSRQTAYWGIAVMRRIGHLWRSCASILKSGSNETCEVVWIEKNKCAACVLLGQGDI